MATVLVVLVTFQLSGCSEWMTYQQAPAEVLAQKSPERVKVTRTDGMQLELYGPEIVNDTLVGYSSELADSTKATGQVLRIPLADIRTMQVHQGNTGGTVILAGLLVLVVVGAIVALPIMDEDDLD